MTAELERAPGPPHRAARTPSRAALVHSPVPGPTAGAPGGAVAAGLRRLGGALRGTAVRGWHDNIADHAAALTYYAVLALVPALLIAVSLVGLVGDGTRERVIADVTAYLPAQSAGALRETLTDLTAAPSSMWLLVATGALSALWSASSYLAVFRRALHAMHRVPDTRPALRTAHTIVITALVLLGLLLTATAGLVLSGPVARRVGALVGLDGTGTWAVLRWPVLMGVVTALILVLFRTGPAGARGNRRGLPGGLLAAVLWLAASGLFTLYAQVGTYSRLYGSLAGVVVFLVWLWLSNLALVIGAQFNVEWWRPPVGAAPAPASGVGPGARVARGTRGRRRALRRLRLRGSRPGRDR
ncbi:YihY/virulence factor BrkB family protein [Streptomyces sp. BI20]|uniref:YihY/virulence factor BrkB family protein n=1 Tax=Streptomyces sp. BI20 TaxID=3403460 RepID=UPI003C786465